MTASFAIRLVALSVGLLLASPSPSRALVEAELDVPRLASSVVVDTRIFHEPGSRVDLDAGVPVSGNCVADPSENCVDGLGIRKLMRFDVLVHNRGDEDLIVGDPRTLPDLFEFSACHGHYHFAQASLYELLDQAGVPVAFGHKQGFCLEDTIPSSPATQKPRKYSCAFQGLQVGYADWYPRELDCQWIDVTDVPPGDYVLHVRWNPQGLLTDADPSNNEAYVPVTIEEPRSEAPVVYRVTHPRSDAVYSSGREMFIQWRARDDQDVATQELWFSGDGGETYTQIVGDLPGSATWYLWSVPDGISASSAKIKVVARDREAQRGELDSATFRVVGRSRLVPRRF